MELQMDPAATAGLVTRTVRTGERDGTTTRIAVAQRSYRTDLADLWDALTNAQRLPRWFQPVSGDLEVGGHYQVEGNAGGVVERCDEPESFAVTWDYGPMHSWLAVTLTPSEHGTTLELVHEAPVDPDMWDQFGPGAVGVGWDLALMGLGLHLDSGATLDHDEAEAFAVSATGVALVRAAATDWAAAAIADGDDPEAAHAAAEATIAFYTTIPDIPDEG